MNGRAIRRCVAFTRALLLAGLAAGPAHAFERTWHLGGGFGAAFPNRAALGPALGAHAAYGISDVFDVRAELQASRHGQDPRADPSAPAFDLPDAAAATLFLARLGLAYKVDVMRLIPYGGPSLGGHALLGPRSVRFGPSVGAFAGLDYAASERLGLGFLAGGDYFVLAPAQLVGFALLRAEYRFGP